MAVSTTGDANKYRPIIPFQEEISMGEVVSSSSADLNLSCFDRIWDVNLFSNRESRLGVGWGLVGSSLLKQDEKISELSSIHDRDL